MPQKKLSHLYLMMKELGVSGNMLADYLSVDGSLVSKWKSGSRKMNADFAERIARLFLSLDEKNSYQRINQLDGFTPSPQTTVTQVQDYLLLWLTAAPREASPLERFISSQAKPLKGYLYTGEAGRREATRAFLDYTAEGANQKVWLYSTQDQKYSQKDPDYLIDWQNKNFAVLENNEIRVIHPIYKDSRYVAEYLLRWLPLHLYGNAYAYYVPRCRREIAEASICLTEGVIGMYSISSPEDPTRVTTFLTTDVSTLQCLRDLLMPVFRESKCLFRRYSYHNQRKYYDAYRSFVVNDEPGYCFAGGPPLFLQGRDFILDTVAHSLLPEEEKAAAARTLGSLSFEDLSANGISPLTVIIHLKQLRELLHYRTVLLRSASYALEKPFFIGQQQFRDSLLLSLETAAAHPQISFLLTENSMLYPFEDIDLFVRGKEIAGFVGPHYRVDNSSRALIMDQREVISALLYNCGYYAETHPNRLEGYASIRADIEKMLRKAPLDDCIDLILDETI